MVEGVDFPWHFLLSFVGAQETSEGKWGQCIIAAPLQAKPVWTRVTTKQNTLK